MTAKELIETLSEVPEDTEVVVFQGGNVYHLNTGQVLLSTQEILYDPPVVEIGLGWGDY